MNRWLEWTPQKLNASPKTEATKLTKPRAESRKFERALNSEPTKLTKPPNPSPPPVPVPAPGEPLEAAVRFDIPGVGDVWLAPDECAAARLNLPAGCWLTPADLALLEGLEPGERVEALVWMRETGGRLAAAPAPPRPWGRGERGWRRWRLENIDRQAAEYRAAKGKGA